MVGGSQHGDHRLGVDRRHQLVGVTGDHREPCALGGGLPEPRYWEQRLILDGELYRGSKGNAGEIGMALLSPRGADFTPLEHRASLAALYQRLGLDPAEPDINAKVEAIALAGRPSVEAWIAEAAEDLRWSVQLIENVLDPQTIVLTTGTSAVLARRLVEAIEPLLPSLADRPDRALPRLQLGMVDPWSVALGAAAEPIGRTFSPRFSAILKAGPSPS